jgi:hypothetical protein
MIKRQWITVLFSIAFVISLVHSSIPHIHPEKVDHHHHSDNQKHSKTKDHHGHVQGEKGNHHDESDHQPEDKELPVFSHFSNADFIGNPGFHFSGSEKFAIDLIASCLILVEAPEEFRRSILFPRARDLPSSRYRSSQSLRAPPFLS